jgi:hypothetical protein
VNNFTVSIFSLTRGRSRRLVSHVCVSVASELSTFVFPQPTPPNFLQPRLFYSHPILLVALTLQALRLRCWTNTAHHGARVALLSPRSLPPRAA